MWAHGQTGFEVGSLTKTFTGLLLAQMVGCVRSAMTSRSAPTYPPTPSPVMRGLATLPTSLTSRC
jgi:hypothetical protein